MKRTPLKRTAWKRKPPKEKSSKGLFDHLKKESRMEEWGRIKREILDPYFHSIGLYNECELGYDKCLGNALPLQYAHSKKRDDIAREEPERTRELCEVIRACDNCHKAIEYIPKDKGGKQKMYEIVIATIEKRNKRLSRWKKVGA